MWKPDQLDKGVYTETDKIEVEIAPEKAPLGQIMFPETPGWKFNDALSPWERGLTPTKYENICNDVHRRQMDFANFVTWLVYHRKTLKPF